MRTYVRIQQSWLFHQLNSVCPKVRGLCSVVSKIILCGLNSTNFHKFRPVKFYMDLVHAQHLLLACVRYVTEKS